MDKRQVDMYENERDFIASFLRFNDCRSEEDEVEGDLYSSLGPALSRFLPYLTPETETDFHSYSLKRLTEPIHKWKVKYMTYAMHYILESTLIVL